VTICTAASCEAEFICNIKVVIASVTPSIFQNEKITSCFLSLSKTIPIERFQETFTFDMTIDIDSLPSAFPATFVLF